MDFLSFQFQILHAQPAFMAKKHRGDMLAKSTLRASQPLELIHANIYGPISPTSNSRKRYTLCFIDDFSRKSWLYLLTTNSVALIYFQFFKTLVEKEKGCNIKCLHTDKRLIHFNWIHWFLQQKWYQKESNHCLLATTKQGDRTEKLNLNCDEYGSIYVVW